MREVELDDVMDFCSSTGCELVLPEDAKEIREVLNGLREIKPQLTGRALEVVERAIKVLTREFDYKNLQ